MEPMTPRARTLLVIQLILLAIAIALYLPLLQTFGRPYTGAGGDARYGQALAEFFLLSGLWLVLAAMVLLGIGGAMPRWAILVALALVPLSGIATMLAEDRLATRPWARMDIIILPALFAAYALWSRWPRLQRMVPARIAHPAALGGIALLTLGSFAVSVR